MNQEDEESGIWVNDDKRPKHLGEEQLKTLRAGLFESAEYAGEIGLEIESFLAEAMGVFKSVSVPKRKKME
jgi:hypothetical protein